MSKLNLALNLGGTGKISRIVDPHFASVVLLTSFDGADAATSATDDSNSAHTLTFNGAAALETTGPKFGSAALNNPGAAGDWVSIGDSADWHLDGQFTLEAWLKLNVLPSVTGRSAIASHYNALTNNRSFSFAVGATDVLAFTYSTNGTSANFMLGATAIPAIDVWHHVAIDRDASNDVRLYLDGVKNGATVNIGALFNSNTSFGIARDSNSSGDNSPLDGMLDEVRITNGVARYATDTSFAVPTARFPRRGP